MRSDTIKAVLVLLREVDMLKDDGNETLRDAAEKMRDALADELGTKSVGYEITSDGKLRSFPLSKKEEDA